MITTTCEIKDEKPNWYHNETILDGTTVNTTYEKECFKCRDFPDKDGIFKWNCTFTEVLRLDEQNDLWDIDGIWMIE